MTLHSVLLVDADRSANEVLAGVLKREDRNIQQFAEAGQAVTRIRESPSDVVVAGVGLNGIDGFKLLRQLHQIRPETKVILTGGEPDPARVIKAIRQQVYSYFHEPVPLGPLADMVQQALDSSFWQDDIKLVSTSPNWTTFDVKCRLAAGERAIQFVREIEADLAPKKQEDIVAAFREVLMNSIEHGGRSDARKHVRVSLLRTTHAVIVHLHDPGKGFHMASLPHAAICNPNGAPLHHVEVRAEHGQRPGGFGILMARNLADDVLYNAKGNEVLLVKYLT
ncbi:MAG TPA: ATP-binding protein [Bryobacteraceae bacterium]|nr:ATP-binding protein [Bryobacteraceae bacterium]